jgi:glycosyltransferase involved in cell wall biosynthesis
MSALPTNTTNNTSHQDSKPNISLIICTFNRSQKLRACLEYIQDMEKNTHFELIIIDNNSTDNTEHVVTEFSKKSDIKTIYYVEKKQGLGAARNSGSKLAHSDIIIYIDDDCYPSKTFLNDYYKIFEQDTSLGFVAGRVELYDPQDLPLTIIRIKHEIYFSYQQRIVAGEIIGANLGLRKKALLDVDGWDEMLGAGTIFPCEDLDVVARLLCTSWRGKYDPQPVVHHHHERKTAEHYYQIMKSYDAGRGAFFGKCLITPSLRRIYTWPWIKSLVQNNWKRSLREIKFASIYLAHRTFKFKH